jgi:excisionase family DNA binding protein
MPQEAISTWWIVMIKMTTLATLSDLEQEMEGAGRPAERDALREAVNALAKREPDFLTTGQAAERLGVSIPTVKRWIERGGLAGGEMGRRWLVSAESVERLIQVRNTLWEMDREGNPSREEIAQTHRSRRRHAGDAVATRTRRA